MHFGSYPGPENPMDDLVFWLETAEARAYERLKRATGRRAPVVGATPYIVVIEECPENDAPEDEIVDLLAPDL